MKTTFIYSLSDSTGVRYIGKSNDPIARLKNHIKESRRRNKYRKDSWIKSLLNSGNLPILNIIEEIEVEDWKSREAYWINFYKDQGCRLVNGTEGGEGSDGFKGKTHSPETRRRISEVSKYSSRLSGEKVHWAVFKNQDVIEIRHEYDNGNMNVKQLCEKYGVSEITIYRIIKRKTYRNI